MKLSEFVRLVRLSEIVGHEKESRTGKSDVSVKSRTRTPALAFMFSNPVAEIGTENFNGKY